MPRTSSKNHLLFRAFVIFSTCIFPLRFFACDYPFLHPCLSPSNSQVFLTFVFFFPSLFRISASSVLFGRGVRLLQAFLYPLRFYTTLFHCLYAHLLSLLPFSTLIIFSCSFYFYIRQFHIFFFSREHNQSFSPTFSHLDSSFYQPRYSSLPLLFFITFSLPHAKLLYLPTACICMREFLSLFFSLSFSLQS